MDYYENDGNMYLECGEYDRAIEMFQKVLTVDPALCNGHKLLGSAYEELGQKEKARKNYQVAIANAIQNNKEAKEQGGDWFVDEEFIEEIQDDLARLEKDPDGAGQKRLGGAADAKKV